MAVHFPEASEEEKEKKEKENAKRVQELEKEGYDKNFTQYLIDSGYSDEDAKAELDKSVYQADKIKKFQESGLSKEEAMKKAETEYKKYKNRTLSDVEHDFLDSIKSLEESNKKYGK